MVEDIEILPLNPIKRIFREAGCNKVSERACIELKNELERIGFKVARKAIKASEHAERTTVLGKDVLLAIYKGD